MRLIRLCKTIGLLLLVGLNLQNAYADDQVDNRDPYETFNRHAYQFNKTLDNIFLKPAAQLYKKILPWPVTKGISNFFDNLDEVTTIINDMLQGSLYYTAADTTRFIVNSTIGIGGLIDVASYRGIPPHVEDFGLTLAKWGYKSSHYFVIPFFGPSTIRDTIAMPVDYELFSVYPYIPSFAIRYGMLGTYYVNKRAQLLDFDEVIKQAALDPYVFERNAYLQHRASLIAQNNGDSTADSYVEENNVVPSASSNLP